MSKRNLFFKCPCCLSGGGGTGWGASLHGLWRGRKNTFPEKAAGADVFPQLGHFCWKCREHGDEQVCGTSKRTFVVVLCILIWLCLRKGKESELFPGKFSTSVFSGRHSAAGYKGRPQSSWWAVWRWRSLRESTVHTHTKQQQHLVARCPCVINMLCFR